MRLRLQDQFGNNAMWTAVFNSDGGYDIVKLLKEYGFDSNSKNNNDRSPLDFAKQIEDEELQKILTSK
ncbi:ankyrin repeat domain-containing protein [Chryseobacterium lactis]|nr:ankyrin repeat domain-containing protein [Chryseobacterium lactis]